jgi:hypothetical protein
MFRATVHTFSIRALVLVGLMAIAMLASTAAPSLGSSNTWTTAGSMTTARTGHTATLLANGEVLVAGGLSNGGFPNRHFLHQHCRALQPVHGPMDDHRQHDHNSRQPHRYVAPER